MSLLFCGCFSRATPVCLYVQPLPPLAVRSAANRFKDYSFFLQQATTLSYLLLILPIIFLRIRNQQVSPPMRFSWIVKTLVAMRHFQCWIISLLPCSCVLVWYRMYPKWKFLFFATLSYLSSFLMYVSSKDVPLSMQTLLQQGQLPLCLLLGAWFFGFRS